MKWLSRTKHAAFVFDLLATLVQLGGKHFFNSLKFEDLKLVGTSLKVRVCCCWYWLGLVITCYAPVV
jgi:hypothetical protein